MLFLFRLLFAVSILLHDSSAVVSPSTGSLAGGTRITISGGGFSEDPFNSPTDGTSSKGNIVLLERDASPSIACDTVDYSSNSEQIVCVTRNSGHGKSDNQLSVIRDYFDPTLFLYTN